NGQKLPLPDVRRLNERRVVDRALAKAGRPRYRGDGNSLRAAAVGFRRTQEGFGLGATHARLKAFKSFPRNPPPWPQEEVSETGRCHCEGYQQSDQYPYPLRLSLPLGHTDPSRVAE